MTTSADNREKPPNADTFEEKAKLNDLDIRGSTIERLKDPEFAIEWLAAEEAEIAAKDARIAELEEALKPFAELGEKIKAGNIIPLKAVGLGPQMVWAEAPDCIAAYEVLCQATTEQAARPGSASLPSDQPDDAKPRLKDTRLHNDCDVGACVACHEDEKNA